VSGAMLAVVDTGPLYATLDLDDDDHEVSAGTLRRPDIRLAIPTLVVAEVSYLAATRLGAEAEATFIAGLSDLDVDAPAPKDWTRIAQLIRKYASFPLGATDASVVALAERLRTPYVITLDRRHFHAVRPAHCEALQLLPE
jgi:predicted nucleic acid-binding protein